MKRILYVLISIFLMIDGVFAQDSLYLYKSGSVIHSRAIADVDSISFVNRTAKPSTTVSDIEGNVYHTVTIGTQTWMVENLRTRKFRDGSSIDSIADRIAWKSTSTAAWCNYNNDAVSATLYGKLYNYYAVTDSRGIAPVGWHVPTDSEWSQLVDFLGGELEAGGKLKQRGTNYWLSPNYNASNQTGFSALPGGCRDWGGNSKSAGNYGNWWTASEQDVNNAWCRYTYNKTACIYRYNYLKTCGFSVKCIKDNP